MRAEYSGLCARNRVTGQYFCPYGTTHREEELLLRGWENRQTKYAERKAVEMRLIL